MQNLRLSAKTGRHGIQFVGDDARGRQRRHHLDFLRFSIAIARLAGIPPGRVVNTFSADRLADWLAQQRER